jgi:hypothetical protein
MDKIKHYAVSIESDVYAISLVDEPAIEENFIYLSKQEQKQIFLEREDKHLIVGPVLIPNKPIYRNNGKEEFYIQFSADTIEKLAYEYLMNGRMYSVTTDHQDIADDICLVESWIKTSENDKSNDYGMELPIGTWMVSMKVENEDVWKRVKSGELRGYSIESFVNLDEIKLSKQDTNMTEQVKMESVEITENFWSKLKSIIAEALGTTKEDTAVEEAIEEVKEEVIAEPIEEELAEEVAPEVVEEIPAEEEIIAEEIVAEVIETVEDPSTSEEEKENELQAIVDKLTEELANKDAEIAEMKKQIEKLSKQPSAEPVKVDASKQTQHPSFLDFAAGRVSYK